MLKCPIITLLLPSPLLLLLLLQLITQNILIEANKITSTTVKWYDETMECVTIQFGSTPYVLFPNMSADTLLLWDTDEPSYIQSSTGFDPIKKTQEINIPSNYINPVSLKLEFITSSSYVNSLSNCNGVLPLGGSSDIWSYFDFIILTSSGIVFEPKFQFAKSKELAFCREHPNDVRCIDYQNEGGIPNFVFLDDNLESKIFRHHTLQKGFFKNFEDETESKNENSCENFIDSIDIPVKLKLRNQFYSTFVPQGLYNSLQDLFVNVQSVLIGDEMLLTNDHEEIKNGAEIITESLNSFKENQLESTIYLGSSILNNYVVFVNSNSMEVSNMLMNQINSTSRIFLVYYGCGPLIINQMENQGTVLLIFFLSLSFYLMINRLENTSRYYTSLFHKKLMESDGYIHFFKKEDKGIYSYLGENQKVLLSNEENVDKPQEEEEEKKVETKENGENEESDESDESYESEEEFEGESESESDEDESGEEEGSEEESKGTKDKNEDSAKQKSLFIKNKGETHYIPRVWSKGFPYENHFTHHELFFSLVMLFSLFMIASQSKFSFDSECQLCHINGICPNFEIFSKIRITKALSKMAIYFPFAIMAYQLMILLFYITPVLFFDEEEIENENENVNVNEKQKNTNTNKNAYTKHKLQLLVEKNKLPFVLTLQNSVFFSVSWILGIPSTGSGLEISIWYVTSVGWCWCALWDIFDVLIVALNNMNEKEFVFNLVVAVGNLVCVFIITFTHTFFSGFTDYLSIHSDGFLFIILILAILAMTLLFPAALFFFKISSIKLTNNQKRFVEKMNIKFI